MDQLLLIPSSKVEGAASFSKPMKPEALERDGYRIITGHRQAVNGSGGHRDEGLLGPREEPIHGATVDETRELLSPAGKLSTHRRLAQDDV